MPFVKGRSKTGGKKKGIVPAIKSVREFLAARGSNPFETLDDIRRGELICNVCRGKKKTRYQAGQGDKTFERTCQSCYGSGFERINPADRARAASELAKYCQPQLKAIEISGNQERPVVAEIEVRLVRAKDGRRADDNEAHN